MKKKQNEIYKVGYKLIREYGLKKVRIEHICREAKVSKTTFYKYFSNKIDFLKELFVDKTSVLYELTNELLHSDLLLNEQLERILSYDVRFIEEWGEEVLLELCSPDFKEVFNVLKEKTQDIEVQWLENQKKMGIINPKIPTELIVLLSEQLGIFSISPECVALYPNREARLQILTEVFFYGIIKR